MLFQEMLTAAKGWLSGRSPEELAELAGAEWKQEEKILRLQSLNQRLEVSTEGLVCKAAAGGVASSDSAALSFDFRRNAVI